MIMTGCQKAISSSKYNVSDMPTKHQKVRYSTCLAPAFVRYWEESYGFRSSFLAL